MVVDDHSGSLENLVVVLSVFVQVGSDPVPMAWYCGIYGLEYGPLVSVRKEVRTGLHQQQIRFSDRPFVEGSNVVFVE